jgi:hypothetical protein
MQARGALRIEAVEAFINGGMSARSSSDDRGSSLGKVAVHRKSRLAHCLPRSNDGELRNSVEKRDLRCFKMSRRLKIFNFADQLIAGLRSGSESWQREGRAAGDQRIPIVFRRLSNRRNNAEAGNGNPVQFDFTLAATSLSTA